MGDVAFADFTLDADRRPVLIRISFDGYGCCTPEDVNVAPMDAADSYKLLTAIESGDQLGTEAIRAILRRYFETHRNVVWEDALIEWGLVRWPDLLLPLTLKQASRVHSEQYVQFVIWRTMTMLRRGHYPPGDFPMLVRVAPTCDELFRSLQGSTTRRPFSRSSNH